MLNANSNVKILFYITIQYIFICIYLKRPYFGGGELKIFEWCFGWIVMALIEYFENKWPNHTNCESNKLQFDILMKFSRKQNEIYYSIHNLPISHLNICFSIQTKMRFMIVFTVWIFYSVFLLLNAFSISCGWIYLK